ncbi:YdcF family protein [Nocardia sp. NPDC127526]|uniref:YdcF family protein n=1 Tax=Nocardia sp. NPDC127526 TaxID=3345393 RepID=UPI003627CEF8
MGIIGTDEDSFLATLAAIVVLLSPLLVLALAGLLMINGVQVVRREGLSLAHLLPLGLGMTLLVPYVLFVVALWTENFWFAVILASVMLVLSYLGFLCVAFLMYAWVYTRLSYQSGMAAIVVHGSGLIGARVPPLLANRLDRALEVYRAEVGRGRHPVVVTSGGRGSDEKVSEAEAMAGYLLDKGLPAEAVLREDRSTTTRENLLCTRDLLAERGIGSRMVLVTSNFHAMRTAFLARDLGLDAEVVGAPTAFYYLPGALLREFIAVLYENRRVNTAVCVALAALPPLLVALAQLLPAEA